GRSWRSASPPGRTADGEGAVPRRLGYGDGGRPGVRGGARGAPPPRRGHRGPGHRPELPPGAAAERESAFGGAGPGTDRAGGGGPAGPRRGRGAPRGCRAHDRRDGIGEESMIDFALTEEHEQVEKMVRDWAKSEVAPKIHDLDR